MIEAGVNVVRLNFSHGKAEDHVARAALVREIAAECGRVVAVMADLQGPKIRIGKFADGKIELQKGDHFILDAACELGNQNIVGLDYKELPTDLKPADVLLLNDGLIVLVVDRIVGSQIFTTVKIGGELSNNKGINRQGGGLSAPALTSKDMEDIKTALVFEAGLVDHFKGLLHVPIGATVHPLFGPEITQSVLDPFKIRNGYPSGVG
jgi:pyruvate kinase